jgi:Uma2 family endonuclease
MSSITGKKVWTYEEYYQLNDDKRYEILQGELIIVPAPDLEHQRISRKLEIKMALFIESKNSGELFHAPVDVILEKGQVVQPDIVYVSNENSKLLQKRGIFGSPDLIVEIISPSSIKVDRHVKFSIYESFKVKEYWVMDPANKTIEIFLLEKDKYKLFCFAEQDEIAKSSVLTDFEVNVNDIM